MWFGKKKNEAAPATPITVPASSVADITIVTIPEHFLPPFIGGAKAKRAGGAIIALGVVLLVGAGGWWITTSFLRPPDLTLPPPVTRAPSAPLAESNPPPVIPSTIGSPSPPQTIRGAVVDAAGTTISSGRLLVGEGALGVIQTIALEGIWPVTSDRETAAGLIVSGVYSIKPSEVVFANPARLVIEYGPEVKATFAELELRGAVKDGGTWRVLEDVVPDPTAQSIGFTIEGLPAPGYALVKPSTTVQSFEPPEARAPSVILASGPDADRDGLTDEEERVYGTDPTRPDSDGDSFADGFEVTNLYNPMSPPPGRLATSNLVNVYNNPTFGYAMFAPAGFLVRATDQTNRDVLFTSSTGEFIEVSVQENQEKISTEVWFRRQFPQESIARLRQWNVSDATAIWSADGTNVYLAAGDKLFVLSYNVGGLERLNFRTTFEMMARSFRPQGAGIATPDSDTESANVSGESTSSEPPPPASSTTEGEAPPAVP